MGSFSREQPPSAAQGAAGERGVGAVFKMPNRPLWLYLFILLPPPCARSLRWEKMRSEHKGETQALGVALWWGGGGAGKQTTGVTLEIIHLFL